MCLLIAKPAGKEIPESAVQEAARIHRDGIGFGVARGTGKVNISKGWSSPDAFYRILRGYWEFPCLVHFRAATHGQVCPQLCHPFPILGKTACVGHNGILTEFTPADGVKDTSDTLRFVREVYEPLAARCGLRDKLTDRIVQSILGDWNKLVTLTARGDLIIYGESAGEWYDGVWYSNDTFKPWSPPPAVWTMHDSKGERFPDWVPGRRAWRGRFADRDDIPDWCKGGSTSPNPGYSA